MSRLRLKVSTSPVYNLVQLAERDALTKIVLSTLEQARVEPGNLPAEIKEMLDVLPPEVRSEVESDWGEGQQATAMEEVRAIIFGIHGQSPDNFLHDCKKLRIRGDIVSRAGERLAFQRRKGNKNTLLDAAGNELPDNALGPFLGTVGQEYFSAMFGLGTRELREGAQQLLSGKGDMGNALFSASMGGTPVQLVLAALTDESDRLFKGRATANVSIRPAANEYRDLLRKSRDAVVNPEAWEKIEKDSAAAEEAKAGFEGEIATFTRDLEWISRCEDALPTVGRLSEEMRKLESLPLMPVLSSDFVTRTQAARKAAKEALAEVNQLTSHVAKLEAQLANCQTSPALLAEAAALDLLHQDLGVYRDRKNFLSDLETELSGIEATLRAGVQNLELTGGFSALGALRLSRAVRLACEEAADDLQNEAKNNLGEGHAAYNQAVQTLEDLMRLAKLEAAEELEPLLANLELRDKAQSQIETFRSTLSGLARGQTLDDFLGRIRAEDTEALPHRKTVLQSRKREKEAALQTVRDALYAFRGQRQMLEAAGDAAAHYRQQAESCAARLRQDASRFLRLRLAAHFLRSQIERFRKENQGPLLEKSGQVFQGITRGAFGGLGAEFNADDTPILVGLRPDQPSVSIEGMSDGTRDQLYLALRLAALDQYLEKHEPMPLILDDLLITCDNDRATAILPQLVTLARRTQVFLFTHHDHLVELCRKTLGEDTFHLHQLDSNPGIRQPLNSRSYHRTIMRLIS